MYKYTEESLKKSKILRKKQTPQEKYLWYVYLSKHKLKFQRQKPIDNYIVDFYCAKAKLVIELDGLHHHDDDNYEYDQRRTGWFEKYGIIVIRFNNQEIDNDFHNVCKIINQIAEERIKQFENIKEKKISIQ